MAKIKTYAWNFRVTDDGALVLRAISQDSIGVMKLEKGWLEFWHLGTRVVKTKSVVELFAAIDKIEQAT